MSCQITDVIHIAERLKAAREEANLTQEQLADAAGVSQGTIANIESGIRKNPRELLAIAKAAHVNPEWLKTGKGPKHNDSNITNGPAARGPYPLISEVQAGEWTELCDHFAPGDAEDWLPSTKNLGACGYMLRVNGKSMENPGGRHSFMDGVILHVNPDLQPMPGQFVIVRREATKEATFKRYTLIDGDPYLEAINPEWPKDKKYLKLQPGDEWCGVVVDASFGNLP